MTIEHTRKKCCSRLRCSCMIFKRTSKFQRTNPEDYRSKLEWQLEGHTVDERGNTIRPIRDTWWLVESESSSKKTYLLQIHMKLFTVDVGHTDQKGRIECDCPSFIYCKYTPRHCKHSIELARRFFGEKSFQHTTISSHYADEPDKWCGENYKIVEAMNGTSKKKKKYHTHAEKLLEQMQEVAVEASREGLTFHPTNK